MKKTNTEATDNQEEPRAEEKVISISIDKIIPNQEQHRITCEDDIKKLAKSIKKDGQLKPIIVRPVGDKYEPITGQGRIEAHILLGKKEINAIIRDYKDDEAYEKGILLYVSRSKISSKDREKFVYTRWTNGKKNGRYKSIADFARKISKSDRWVSDNIRAYKDREEIFGPEGDSDHISTDTLRRIKTLSLPDKKKFCARIKDGKIKPCEAREAVKFLKSKPVSEEIKESILDGDIHWRIAKAVIENRQPILKELEKAIALYHNKETIQKIIEDEKPHFSAKPYRTLAGFINTIESKSIESIEDVMEKNQAIRDLRIAGTEIFHYLQELKEIDNKQYHKICDISKISSEIIQHLKDDGHYYFFPDEWLKPKEKKLKEMMNKLLTGKDEPLMRLR